MKFEPEIYDYLNGKKFSNGLVVRYDYNQVIPSRVKLLADLAKGKNILHLGCLDHLPLIDDKIKNNQWLHKILTENAATCLGVDIEAETKEYVEKKHGFSNIVLGDFTKEKLTAVTAQRWDYAILGEILEHIDNPVNYLAAIAANYKNSIDKIVITVPNAFTQTSFRMAEASAELINSDHRYWFTPYTLAKVIFHSGLKLEEILFANRIPLKGLALVTNKLRSIAGMKNPQNFTYASSIVAVASI